MNRRDLLAALPLAALAGPAFAQQPATPPAVPGAGAGRGGGRGAAPAAPAAPVQPALPMTIVASGLAFPEAPVWMKDGSLLFVQIPNGEISRLTPDGKVEMWCKTGDSPNGLAFGPDGGLYVANDGNRFGFTRRPDGSATLGGPSPTPAIPGKIQKVDPRTRRVTTLYTHVEGKEMIAPDDLVFDPSGGLWISEYGRTAGQGAIYYATPDGKIIKVARAGMNSPNGIGVSPDGKMLHVSMGNRLYGFDIVGPGKLATNTYPDGVQSPLNENGTADSLKVMADGRVAVCTLLRPGGIGIHTGAFAPQFLAFPDRFTTNIAFGGADYRDAWLTFSDTGRIAKVRWPAAGLKPIYPR